MNKNITLSIILFTIGQIFIWYQSNGQFISNWFKNNTLLVSLFGVPISYLFIHATRMSYEGFGATWPGRMLGFATGVLVFTILAYYYMGEVYLTVLDLEAAALMFKKTYDLHGDHVVAANMRWKLVQKILQAGPATLTGKKMAFIQQMTRADMALLLLEEMKIDALYASHKPPIRDIGPGTQEKEPAGHILF